MSLATVCGPQSTDPSPSQDLPSTTLRAPDSFAAIVAAQSRQVSLGFSPFRVTTCFLVDATLVPLRIMLSPILLVFLLILAAIVVLLMATGPRFLRVLPLPFPLHILIPPPVHLLSPVCLFSVFEDLLVFSINLYPLKVAIRHVRSAEAMGTGGKYADVIQ